MNELFTKAMERISHWLFPASGRHRAIAPFARPAEQHIGLPTLRRAASSSAATQYVDDSVLVRPYVLSAEERRGRVREARRPLLVRPYLDVAHMGGERT